LQNNNYDPLTSSISCLVGSKDGEFHCAVKPALHVGCCAVELVTPTGGSKFGVFVRNATQIMPMPMPIDYIGESEWAMMNGSIR
jgi:hypothetical protein